MSRGELTDAGRRHWQEKQERRARIYRRRRALAVVLLIAVLLLIGYLLPRAWNWVSQAISDAFSGETLSGEGPLDEVRGNQIPEPEAPGETGPADAEADDQEPSPAATPEEDPERASDPSWDPDSIHVLVNRQNPLRPEDYAPEDLVAPEVRMSTQSELLLRQEAAEALEELIQNAGEDGQVLAMTSGYRSYAAQLEVYTDRHSAVGTEETDELVARPGYSEHQTGLAADVISIDNPNCIQGHCFADTPEGQWVAEHAADHGFVIRYLDGAEEITGYQFEPWHLRYVGEETAQEVAAEDLTLEEYWDRPAASEYDVEEPDLDPAGTS
ncbi:M15 family metallopeptidase [Nesterenkonia halotolerans]|uniref:D-alanyl-D-alanine carboxypeptidase n=1 Tax=Nesterenkonia halotolerans TaxID=225325 RepID=A0ABR9J8Z0_9MICC|nr:M15 family metallopeptidase [Nesterenkonia halotolerans]MBE1515461.1 D-alanyl-D-alanine carboxypeptidase [Nesterenkonia halotolerans]